MSTWAPLSPLTTLRARTNHRRRYVAEAPPGTRVQFERTGYFCVDEGSTAKEITINRIVTLRDTWAAAPSPPKKSTPKKKKAQKTNAPTDKGEPAKGS